LFEAFFYLSGDAVVRANFPLVEPDSKAVFAQTFGETPYDRLVLGTVTKKDVERE
jgi:hypothetical protein